MLSVIGIGPGSQAMMTMEAVEALQAAEIVVGYKVGDTVRISDGPLESFSGIVEEIDAEKNKVTVVVSMFGRETPVELDLDQIESI